MQGGGDLHMTNLHNVVAVPFMIQPPSHLVPRARPVAPYVCDGCKHLCSYGSGGHGHGHGAERECAVPACICLSPAPEEGVAILVWFGMFSYVLDLHFCSLHEFISLLHVTSELDFVLRRRFREERAQF